VTGEASALSITAVPLMKSGRMTPLAICTSSCMKGRNSRASAGDSGAL